MHESITQMELKQWQEAFLQNPQKVLASHAIRNAGIDAAAQNPDVVKRHSFVFNHICKQGEPTTQKKSGRCWYFAALNSLRPIVMEKLKVKNFEFSETYLYFFDKLEKANVFLEECISNIDLDIRDRKFFILLQATVYDGGFWQYFTHLCTKYGLIPKSEGPETFHSADSYMFTKQMDLRLKRTLAQMRRARAEGADVAALRVLKEAALQEIYQIASQVLGLPVERFTFSYTDEDEKVHTLPEMTPLEFFEQYVGKEELERRIVLISDPRRSTPLGRLIEVEGVRNVLEQPCAQGLNVPISVLVDAAMHSIQDGEPMWFACDVGKDIDRNKGILDAELFDYDGLLTPIGDFTKEERFELGYSAATHAMNLTGVHLDSADQPLYWKVENSWGEDLGKKGTFSMSQKWFEEFVYELIVDRKYVPEEFLKGLEQEPVTLPCWDLMAKLLSGRATSGCSDADA